MVSPHPQTPTLLLTQTAFVPAAPAGGMKKPALQDFPAGSHAHEKALSVERAFFVTARSLGRDRRLSRSKDVQIAC